MKVAIPIFEGNIAPRFGFASQFLVATIDNHIITERTHLNFEPYRFLDRLETLKNDGVETILCGGFNRSYLPIASGMGLTIIDRLYGDSETVLHAYAKGSPLPGRLPRCKEKQHRFKRSRKDQSCLPPTSDAD